jgi:hypothetical protein
MADNTLEIKINVLTEAVEKGLKNVEKAVGNLGNFIKDGNQTNTKSFEDLAKNISKSLDEAFKHVSKSMDDTGKKIEEVTNGWGKAFAKIEVFKNVFSGVSSVIGNMVKGPMELEKAMNSLAFVSEDVKNNLDGIQDSFMEMARAMPIKSTSELAHAMKDLVADGYDTQMAMRLIEESARGAVAGSTSVVTSVGALKNVLGAYNMGVGEATRVQDLLFKSIQMTGESYDTLAMSIAGAVPNISAMGVGFEDFIGSVTTLTKMNTPLGESVNLMELAATALTRKFGSGFLETRTLTEGLLEVYEQAGGKLEHIIDIVK